MHNRFYCYADLTSLAILESTDEKAVLVGGDLGYGNFGDILQLSNTVSFHSSLGRYRSVGIMHASAISDVLFSDFVRQYSSLDAVLFLSENPLDLHGCEPLLHSVRVIRNVGALHLYGGGFLNDRWGDFVLGITEFLLRSLKPTIYIVSGQQITHPYQSKVLQHVTDCHPAIFAVRDYPSAECLLQDGFRADFSFDDATEALQLLIPRLAIQQAPGMFLHLNASDYTNDISNSSGLQADLCLLKADKRTQAGLTVFQAYCDKRVEIQDSKESIKELERRFPFADYRMLELTHFAFDHSARPSRPLAGEIGYSCSYHVALLLQLAQIPCWLRGGNPFYQQKCRALQIGQSLEDFLHGPIVADHRTNLEKRHFYQERLRQVILSAPKAIGSYDFSYAEDIIPQAWKYKGNHRQEWRLLEKNIQYLQEQLSQLHDDLEISQKKNAQLYEQLQRYSSKYSADKKIPGGCTDPEFHADKEKNFGFLHPLRFFFLVQPLRLLKKIVYRIWRKI